VHCSIAGGPSYTTFCLVSGGGLRGGVALCVLLHACIGGCALHWHGAGQMLHAGQASPASQWPLMYIAGGLTAHCS
jgi:hypothetical protein